MLKNVINFNKNVQFCYWGVKKGVQWLLFLGKLLSLPFETKKM